MIEREENAASVHESPTSCANHWLQRDVPGHGRGHQSTDRLVLMESTRDKISDGFDWVTDPILNETTRIAVVANAMEGKLVVRGYEKDGPVTRDYQLPARF